MTFDLGDSFFADFHDGDNGHLRIIITHPYEGKCLAASMLTTYTNPEDTDSWKDPSCVLVPEDGHSFIKHASCIAFNRTIELTSEEIQILIETGEANPKETFREQAIRKILYGAKISNRLHKRFKKIMKDQGLFENL